MDGVFLLAVYIWMLGCDAVLLNESCSTTGVQQRVCLSLAAFSCGLLWTLCSWAGFHCCLPDLNQKPACLAKPQALCPSFLAFCQALHKDQPIHPRWLPVVAPAAQHCRKPIDAHLRASLAPPPSYRHITSLCAAPTLTPGYIYPQTRLSCRHIHSTPLPPGRRRQTSCCRASSPKSRPAQHSTARHDTALIGARRV